MRPATLKDVTEEQERIGVLLNSWGFWFVDSENLIDLIVAVELANQSGDRSALEAALYDWSMPYVKPPECVDELMSPGMFEWRWDDASQTTRTWFYKRCGCAMLDGHNCQPVARPTP